VGALRTLIEPLYTQNTRFKGGNKNICSVNSFFVLNTFGAPKNLGAVSCSLLCICVKTTLVMVVYNVDDRVFFYYSQFYFDENFDVKKTFVHIGVINRIPGKVIDLDQFLTYIKSLVT